MPMHSSSRVPGRGWAYTGAVLGGAVSIAANVAHSYVPPENARNDWTPEVGAVISAVFWPVALFVAIEILTRIQWPPGWRWTSLRYCGLVPVTVVAGIVSYRHLSDLLDHYGEDGWVRYLGPLAVDGLMGMSCGALLATAGAAAVAARRSNTAEPVPVPDSPEPVPVPVTTAGRPSTAVEPTPVHVVTVDDLVPVVEDRSPAVEDPQSVPVHTPVHGAPRPAVRAPRRTPSKIAPAAVLVWDDDPGPAQPIKTRMRLYAMYQRTAGRLVSGADLDRLFGSNPASGLGRKTLRELATEDAGTGADADPEPAAVNA